MSELALPSMPRHSPDAMLAKRPTSAIGTQDGKEILLAREPEVDKFPVALRLFTRLAHTAQGGSSRDDSAALPLLVQRV